MIERVVLVKLKGEFARPERRAQVVAHSVEALRGVPQVKGVSIGVPADDRSAKDWDLCIQVRFDRLEDVESYAVDPRHRAYVDDYLRPKIEVIKAWNFASSR